MTKNEVERIVGGFIGGLSSVWGVAEVRKVLGDVVRDDAFWELWEKVDAVTDAIRLRPPGLPAGTGRRRKVSA